MPIQRVPLKEIRDRLSCLSLAEVRALLAEEAQREAALRYAERATSPKEYISSLLGRVQAARRLREWPAPQVSHPYVRTEDFAAREARPAPTFRPHGAS